MIDLSLRKESGEDLYGWVRLSVQIGDGAQSFTIFDYAYEDNGSGITAGAGIVSPGSVGINEDLVFNNLKAYSTSNGQLKVSSDDRINGDISLINSDLILVIYVAGAIILSL